jgi:hypothetical protein
VWVKHGLSNDSAAVVTYPWWWQKYFASIVPNHTDSLQVILSHVYYQPEFVKSPADSVIFTAYYR